jgi:hypothetical protein
MDSQNQYCGSESVRSVGSCGISRLLSGVTVCCSTTVERVSQHIPHVLSISASISFRLPLLLFECSLINDKLQGQGQAMPSCSPQSPLVVFVATTGL